MLPSRRVLIVAGLCAVITASGCTSSGEKDTVAKGGPASTAFQQVSFMSAEIPAGNTERTFDHVVL